MADLTAMLQAAAGQAGEDTDPFFNQTTLLLHGDGTNGAQNNTFLDSSSNTFTITRNGNTTQGTFSPFSLAAGEWSNFFDGASDYLTTPVSANLALGGSDFCIEWWEYRTSIADSEAVMGGNTSYVALYDPIIAWPSGSDIICYLSTGASWDLLSAFDIGTATANQWIHRALTRDGNTFRGFENGVLINTTTASGSVYMSANSWRIGQGQNQGANTFPGYISNLRMVIGSPVYTSAFTPSTTPLTTTSQNVTASEVELLTCQSNRFVDNSSNSFAITVNGNVSIQPFSPFAPSAAYDPSVNGGSGYFDGSDDLRAVNGTPISFGTGDFTIEAWIYPTVAAESGIYTHVYNISLFMNSNYTIYASTPGDPGWSTLTSTGAVKPNSWNHVALTRSSGTAKIWINGVEEASGSRTFDLTYTSGDGAVGAYFNTVNTVNYFTGYISNVRIVKGTAVYTSAFTPPTAPLSAITNTQFLTLFTNAGIFDNTGKNNLETVGNAQIDTSVKKYGTGSMEFDGTGDYITVPASPNLDLTTGNFTIECWFYYSTTPPSGAAYDYLWAIGSNNINGLGLYIQGGTPKIWNNSSVLTTTGSISATTWYHIAVVRSSGTLVVYLDGVSIGSVSLTSNLSGGGSSGFNIARWINAPDLEDFTGYIDDLRITKGVARYTAAFTPPTAAFPDL